MIKLQHIFFLVLLLTLNFCFAEAKVIPRTIIALYDETFDPLTLQLIVTAAEMPLNYLGLKVEYYDIKKPLPDIKDNPNIRGILTWFDSDDVVPKPKLYIDWLQKNIIAGKKVVIIDSPGFLLNPKTKKITPTKDINKIFKLLGIEFGSSWENSYHSKIIYENPKMIGYEKTLSQKVFPYHDTKIFNHQYKSYLKIAPYGNSKLASDLVVTGPNGGYIASNYAFFSIFSKIKGQDLKKWIINPFLFFEKSFDTNQLPKPDVTTLNGLRMFFSHIDGDGWNNVTLVKGYDPTTLSAEVIYEKILLAYPNIPVTVSAIAADIDREWVGTDQSIDIAKKIFALRNVQLATHTYSHPFEWSFFKHYNYKKEIPFLSKYAFGSWQEKENKVTSSINSWFTPLEKNDNETGGKEALHNDYNTPRAFANKKFDLHNEIVGSTETINKLAPSDKKTNIVLWSGDTSPFESAIRTARQAGLYNMNGGDSRFDDEYSSVSWVTGIGKKVGNEIQIYSANSNENTYTELWTDRYFGFKFLPQTFINTEIPKRLKPMDLYYHMYSGEKDASLYALLENIKYIQTQPKITVTALDYIKAAIGFYSTEISQTDDKCWIIKNRGKLNTIRFPHAPTTQIDTDKSLGVIGQNYHRSSLYVALEPTAINPRICLKNIESLDEAFSTNKPYIMSSTWQVSHFNYSHHTTSFSASGWGKGIIKMVVPKAGDYLITINNEHSYHITSNGNFITLPLKNNANRKINVIITPK